MIPQKQRYCTFRIKHFRLFEEKNAFFGSFDGKLVAFSLFNAYFIFLSNTGNESKDF